MASSISGSLSGGSSVGAAAGDDDAGGDSSTTNSSSSRGSRRNWPKTLGLSASKYISPQYVVVFFTFYAWCIVYAKQNKLEKQQF